MALNNIDNNILKQVQKYLESNEEILVKYKPIVKLKKKIIIGISGILGLILILPVIILITYIRSTIFFVISIFVLIIPMCYGIMYGTLTLLTLPGILLDKKSLYIFTNQKLIVKYPKQFIIVKLNNIASINRINKKNKYHLIIVLKKELESSPFTDKSIILIRNISKDNELKDKLKYITEVTEI